ncbi:MAG: bifunctional riboflavin kinase/FAD synthetase [Kiritimatiellae bacterium]|nr:bifunctional riboflavin kinase/FAD synthetase [Kiritimatiellia bacterium]
MRILNDITKLRRERRGIFLALGFFDGVHRGHRRVIARCEGAARRRGGQTWVLTFDTHPQRVLDPENAPRLLTSTAHKLKLLQQAGVDGCLVLPFTRELAGEEPERFVGRLLANARTLKHIFAGQDWRFGRNRRGTPALLKKQAAGTGVRVSVVSPELWRGSPISSTRIRTAVQEGSLREAKGMLGRDFSILGTVVRGRHLGTRIGYPTANLDPHNEVWPPFGVYAAHARIDGRRLVGVVNVGTCPTVVRADDAKPSIEIHLLDFSQSLDGQDIEISFAARLRNEHRFCDVDHLKRQIARDVRKARRMLAQ